MRAYAAIFGARFRVLLAYRAAAAAGLTTQLFWGLIVSMWIGNLLLGTIYLPNGRLTIDSDDTVADKSAYTVIVARQFQTEGAPDIVINSNYDSTNIPVPDGVGPGLGSVMLVQ